MAEPNQKPLDSWLGILGVVVGILFYLLPKTPTVVVGSLILILVLLVHPIWNFWWIEESLARRTTALAVLIVLIVLVGVFVWPEPSDFVQEPKPSQQESKSSQLPAAEEQPKTVPKVEPPAVVKEKPSPDLIAEFVDPDDIRLVISNPTTETAHQPKFMTVLVDLNSTPAALFLYLNIPVIT